MNTPRLLRPSDYKRMRWKNGGGITTEIARSPGEGDAWDWRVSIAEIAQDGDFSIFPGVDRELMLLDGGGVELDVAGEPVQLERRYQKHAFPGEAPVSCRLLDGPTRDFNLMLRRGTVHGELLARPIVGPMVFFADAGTTWLIHVANGAVELKDRPDAPTAQSGDTLILEHAEARSVLTGHGELVLVKIAPV